MYFGKVLIKQEVDCDSIHRVPDRAHAAKNWRIPSAELMMPNTGSGICLRRA
jgi:hypothetical protein